MSTLSFNTATRIPHKPITKTTNHLPKPTNLSFPLSHSQRHHNLKAHKTYQLYVSAQEEVEVDEDDEDQEEREDFDDDPTSELSYLDPETDPESIVEWELDFCSRPILDIRGKKVWELVVCDDSLSLQYTKYFPNNVINSVTLKDALVSISEDLGVPLPEKVRFFRFGFCIICPFLSLWFICMFFVAWLC